jgi:hypothetical protein
MRQVLCAPRCFRITGAGSSRGQTGRPPNNLNVAGNPSGICPKTATATQRTRFDSSAMPLHHLSQGKPSRCPAPSCRGVSPCRTKHAVAEGRVLRKHPFPQRTGRPQWSHGENRPHRTASGVVCFTLSIPQNAAEEVPQGPFPS